MDKMNYKNYLLIYYIILNIYTYILMGIDKKRSKKQQRRITERRLLFLGFLGGGFGLNFGIKRFKHKTKHKQFTWGAPLFIIMHLILIYIVLIRIK